MISLGRPVGKCIERKTSMSPDTDTAQDSWELPGGCLAAYGPHVIPPRNGKTVRSQTVGLKRITEDIFSGLPTGIQWQACLRERFGPPAPVLLLLPMGQGLG